MSVEAELHQTIGELRAAFKHVDDTMKNMVAMWSNQEKDAAAGRRALYEKVESMKDSVVALTSRVASVEHTISAIKPAVKEFEDRVEQQKGAMKLGKLIWAGVLAACGSTGVAIGWGIKALAGLPTPPHP